MKKLNLTDLQIESFATSQSPPARGTVAGYATDDTFCGTDYGQASCNDWACQNTYHDPGCDTGTGPAPTVLYSCGNQDTCVKGATHCGTCNEPSCIPGTGCGGTTDGIWQC